MDEISLDAYAARSAHSLSRCFASWSRMSPQEWAEEVYRLPSGGRFRWSYAPYARAMHASLFDRATIETSFMLYSRGLKSTVVLLALGYFIDQSPRRILSLWPTNSQAEKWSKDILTGELFDTTPPLHFLGSQTGRRLGSNTLLHKLFPGGLIDMFGANAPGDMRRAKGSLLYGEEIDAIEETSTDEGDQMAIFAKRGDEYPDTIRVWASYPSLKILDAEGRPAPGHSRIDSKLLQSDGNQWFSTCLLCGGEPFVMHRSQILYDKDRPEEARLECPRCKGLLTDPQRYDMAHRQGFDNWRPQREFRGRRGFHANAMLWPHPSDPIKCPGGALQMIAQQAIAAERADNPQRAVRVLVNTVDAEPFDPVLETEKPPAWEPLLARRESYTVPASVLVITGAADLQLNRIEVEWKGWGRNEQSFGLDHVVIDGDVRDPGTWGLLKRELQRTFLHELGAPLPFSMFFIDGGFWSEWLYRFLADLARTPILGVTGKVRAIKGVGASPHPVCSDWRSISKNLKGYHIGTWQIKDLLNARLAMRWNGEGEPPTGWMRWNERYGESYFRQLCTGKVTVEIEGSEVVRKFLNAENLRDEGLDLNVYNYAAFRRKSWDFDAIELQLLAEVALLRSGAEAPEPESTSVVMSGGGWRV